MALTVWVSSVVRAETAENNPEVLPGYQGVVPVVRDDPAMALPARGLQAQLTWAGFQVLEGGAARIFLQFTGNPKVELQKKQPSRHVVIEFPGAAWYKKNNLRRADTRHFASVVHRYQVRSPRKNLLRLEVSLASPRLPDVHTEESGVYQYVYVDFGPAENAK